MKENSFLVYFIAIIIGFKAKGLPKTLNLYI